MSPGARHLVALDLDGTVLHENGEFSGVVGSAVLAAEARGHEVMIATGRSWEHTGPIIERLGIRPAYVVCANGALTMRRLPDGEYERYRVETFDPSEVLTTIRPHLADGRYMVEFPDGSRNYTRGMADWDLVRATEVDFEGLLGRPVTRIVVVSPEHDEEDFLSIVEKMGLHQVTYAIGWTAWLDIAPHGVNKSVALEKVRSWLDVPASRVIAAGDGRNDIEMLEWAAREGRGVAMGQAPDEVKAVANETTGAIDEDGLVAVLDALP